MMMSKNPLTRRFLSFLCATAALLSLAGCARMGTPDGGWYDDTPPRVIAASPAERATGVKQKKAAIYFNEFIKVDDPQNKVVVSPTQIETPDIKTSGKRIIVELLDSLQDNTTYTIDFSDAITDNNEGNPLGNYTYSFSTGNHIDTLEVAGYALNAEDLEPLKGILVGLYDYAPVAVTDSGTLVPGLLTKPMRRVARTDSRGFFRIRGVAQGQYLVAALKDADGDFCYNQKSETLGFTLNAVSPSSKPDTRQDTLWRDTLHIESIKVTPYTHFLPDDVPLLCFQALQTDRFLLKTERKDPEKFTLFFTYGSDTLPSLRGLNFDETDAFVIESTEKRDTITYWLRDTALVNRDTLQFELGYHMTDTLGNLVWQTDTLEALPKVSYEKRMKELDKQTEKWQKEQDKKKKKGLPYDSIQKPKPLPFKLTPNGAIAPDADVRIETNTPLAVLDTALLHLEVMIDSVWQPEPFAVRQRDTRSYDFMAAWRADTEFRLTVDSLALVDIYGKGCNPQKVDFKVRNADEYSTLSVTLTGVPAPPADSLSAQMRVQLLDNGDKVVREATVIDGSADFFYLNPGKYYLRAYQDWNGNGRWDTGDFALLRQAEPVYYHPEAIECKQKWDVTRTWNLTRMPIYKQKPQEITKQKGEQARKLRDRNAERARQKGIEYIKKNAY